MSSSAITNWSGEGIFYAPYVNSTGESGTVHTCLMRPLRQTLSASVVGNHSACGFVVALFRNVNPSAVLRRVITVIINSVNGVFSGRRHTHIREELFK